MKKMIDLMAQGVGLEDFAEAIEMIVFVGLDNTKGLTSDNPAFEQMKHMSTEEFLSCILFMYSAAQQGMLLNDVMSNESSEENKYTEDNEDKTEDKLTESPNKTVEIELNVPMEELLEFLQNKYSFTEDFTGFTVPTNHLASAKNNIYSCSPKRIVAAKVKKGN